MNNIKKCLKNSTITEWLLLGVIIGDNGWWFIWGTQSLSGYFWMINALIVIFLYRRKLSQSKNLGTVILFFIYFVILQTIFHSKFHTSSLILSLLYLVGYQLSPKQGAHTLELLTYYVVFSIILSLPSWLIHQFIHPFSLLSQIDIGLMKTGISGSVLMDNYGLFVMPVEGMDIFRFYGPFDEPGVLGTLSAFILWANRYKFNELKNVIILIGAIFTFSIAFYILFSIGLFLKSGFSVKRIILVIVFICIMSFVLMNVFNENEGFQSVVIERLTNFEEYNTDSRTNDSVNSFWDKYLFSLDSLFGMGSGYMASKFGGGGSSYKNFIIEYGILGLCIIVSSYLSMVLKKRKFEYCTLLLFLFSFLQRPLLLSGYEVVMFIITIKSHEFYNDSR